MSKVSVIIPNYNGRPYLANCLAAIAKNLDYHDCEVVIVDNGSTDDSVVFCQTHYPNYRLVRLPQNLGYAGGMNAGASAATGEYLLFLDSDTKVTPHWVQPLVKIFEHHPEAQIVTSQIIDETNPGKGKLYVNGGVVDGLGFPCPSVTSQLVINHELGAILFGATSWMVRRARFQDIGGFDQDFSFFGDDLDLCWRLLLGGGRAYVAHQSQVYHYKEEKDLNKPLAVRRKQRVVFERDYLITLWKNYSAGSLVRINFMYFVWQIPIIGMEIINRDPTLSSHLRGLWQAMWAWPKTKRRRAASQRCRRISDQRLFANIPKNPFSPSHIRFSFMPLPKPRLRT